MLDDQLKTKRFDKRLGSGGSSLLGQDLVLLHQAHEALLLLGSLEATVSELGGRIDELQVDLLEGDTLDLLDQRLAQSDWSFGCAHDAALEHDEVLTDHTVAWEATLFINKDSCLIFIIKFRKLK